MKCQVLLMCFLSCANSLPFLNRCVDTPSGKICGTTYYYDEHPVQTFLGIPFAQPPLGNLRFLKTQPLKPWSGTLIAEHWPPACTQFTAYPFPWYDFKPNKSEDCLYLNVWAPNGTKSGDGKAVLFWIFGGGFTLGSNRLDIYDGRALAAVGDVIVVTINYRLGLFGFLTSHTKEASGNVGLYDVLEALKWVNAHIEAFGGDRERITIHGESAGAMVNSLICVSPLTEGLFSRAIMQSGSAVIFETFPANYNLDLGQRLSERVGCASENTTLQNDPGKVINCLRGKSASYLAYVLYTLNPTSTRSFVPEYGEEFVPGNLVQELKTGNFHKVPLLIGNNADEGSLQITTGSPELFGFFGGKNPIINKTLGETMIRKIFTNHPDPDSVVKQYLGHLEEDSYDAIRRQVYTASGDFSLLCTTLYFAESYANRDSDVYYYFFAHHPSTSPWAPWMGAAHYEEVQFVFGLPLRYPSRYKEEEIQLSARMVKIWSQFAKNGYPTGSFEWPKYSKENHTYYILSTDFNGERLGMGPHLENCNFFRDFFGF